MRSYRTLSAAVFAVVFCALLGRVLRPERAGRPGPDSRAVQGVYGRAECGRDEFRRRSRVGPARLRRHHRDAPDARSALELHGSAQLRADARAAGRPLLRPRHLHSGGRRRDHRLFAVRRVSRLPEGRAPRRRDRADRREGHQGVDQRPGGAAAARAARDAGARSRSSAPATTS